MLLFSNKDVSLRVMLVWDGNCIFHYQQVKHAKRDRYEVPLEAQSCSCETLSPHPGSGLVLDRANSSYVLNHIAALHDKAIRLFANKLLS